MLSGRDRAVDVALIGIYYNTHWINPGGRAGAKGLETRDYACSQAIAGQWMCHLTGIYCNKQFTFTAACLLSAPFLSPPPSLLSSLPTFLQPTAPAGNNDTCNYVEGEDHCYYLDNVSSGVTIKGGVCLRAQNGIKLNGGKQ